MTKDEALDLALEALEYIENNYMSLPKSGSEAITAIKQARSAPVQEPVAFNAGVSPLYPEMKDGETISVEYTTPPGGRQSEDCLTAAQRQWTGLTDEEIAELRRLHEENERLAGEVANRNRRALDGDEAVAALSNVHAYYEKLERVNAQLVAALNAMLTHMGMDEDEWNKPTFDKARAAIAAATGGCIMNKQPEALRLADALIEDASDHHDTAYSFDMRPEDTLNWRHYDNATNAAAELRRLYAEVDRLSYRLAYPDNFAREWVGLTDEAIWSEYQTLWPFHPAEEPGLAKDIAKFARAIEAKLKEKNGWYRQHVIDGSPCWCEPETSYTDPETGASVVVHKEPQ
jgi:hypothetical protein